MNFKPKKWQIVIAITVALLLILNPSLKDFKEYTGDKDGGEKKMNFLVASVYKYEGDYYIGFLLNFIPVN